MGYQTVKGATDRALAENGKAADLPRVKVPGGGQKRFLLVVQGSIGGLIASVCCLLPAVAIAIGLTGGLAATLVSLGRLRLYGIVAGLAFVGLASWLVLRRSRSCCTEEEYKRRQIAIPLTLLASFGIVYGLIMYLILPLLYRLG